MAGYFKDTLTRRHGRAARTIDQYRQGLLPLVVPMTLLRHHVRQHDVRISPVRSTSARTRKS
jgi:uncharacterized protein YbgA (DUF1722 family)